MARSRWAKWWLIWLAAFVIADVIASWPKHHKPRSASEYLGHLFPRGWKRAVLVAILTVALIHIATQPEYVPVPIEGRP